MKYNIDYNKNKITGWAGNLIQHMSLVPIIFTLLGYHLVGHDRESEGKATLFAGRFLNVLLCSGALAAGLTVLYKAHKINLGTTIGVSVAFPLLWITSAVVGFLNIETGDFEDRMRDFTYCNPVFALTVLPVTMLADTVVNTVKEYCRGADK